MMNRERGLWAAWLMSVLFLCPHPATGQVQLAQLDARPRFLAPDSRGAPREVNVSQVALLRRRVSLSREDRTVGQVLQEISRQTGLRFAYKAELLSLDRVVGLRADSITVAAALTEILVDTGIDVLLKSPRQAVLLRRSEPIQPGSIAGLVTDAENGKSVVSADVYLEGTSRRATTGEDGRYRLTGVEAGSYTLAVRRVGYAKRTQSVTIGPGDDLTVDVVLQPVATQLEEIVTTVTGNQRALELGHVVGRINADSLVREAPISSLSDLIGARVPGVQVAQVNGTVGGRVKVQIRGPTSINLNNQPIVIVDGIRYTNGERAPLVGFGAGNVEPTSALNDININDIESIEVVKGPSASTLYGTDAANGVIVVTTKRGQPGPPRWTAYARATSTSIPQRRYPDIFWGWGTVDGVPSNPDVSCTLARLASGECTQQDSISVVPNPLNDPQYTILASKPTWEYGASVAGGRQDLRYHFSADYQDATGPIQMPPALAAALREQRGADLPEEWRKPNAFTKLNLRSDLSADLGERASLRVNAGYIRNDTRTLPRFDDAYTAAFFRSTPGSPYGSTLASNPAEAYAQTTNEQADRVVGGASGEWRPKPWLETRAILGLDLTSSTLSGFIAPGDQPHGFGTADGSAQDSRSRQVATTAELGVSATGRSGRLSSRTAVGTQYVRTLFTASGVVGLGLPPGTHVPQNALTTITSQAHVETVVLGGYAEEMVGLNDRLFLTGALRVDGASTFGQGYNAAVYPKLGASWLLSEEPFLARLSGLGDLRLRYAFGTSGRQPSPASARPLFSPDRLWLNGEVANQISLMGLGNRDLGPERVREHEFGADLTALDNRLSLELTWFRKRTSGMVVEQPGPVGSGGAIATNLGLVTQHGFEAQVHARVLDTRVLSWDLALQHSSFTSRLDDIGNATESRQDYGGYVEGYPIGARFQQPILGWSDANGDGIIASDEVQLGDPITGKVYIGQSIPPRSQTLTSVLGFFRDRLRLSALLERKAGFTQLSGTTRCGATCRANVDPNTPLAEQAEAAATGSFFLRAESGDFIRLREVSAALELPAGVARALRVRSALLSLSARNLALWTDFSGPDPEVGDVGLDSRIWNFAGGTAGGIPQSRTFSLRLDLGF